MRKPNVDSREYRFIYLLKNSEDIPADFLRQRSYCDFEAGVFVPQGDSNLFQAIPSSPARLLLLQDRSLHIVPHPASQRQVLEINLDDLLQIESGTVLLSGWLKFVTSSGVQEVQYNTRASDPIDNFLKVLRRRWLMRGSTAAPSLFPKQYGDELDIKFKNLLRQEIDPGEAIFLLYFQQPMRTEKTVMFGRRVEWKPGNLVALTSANRLLWITDQYRRYRDPYLSVNRSVPAASIRDCECTNADGNFHLFISFVSGTNWSMNVDTATPDLSSFIAAVHEGA